MRGDDVSDVRRLGLFSEVADDCFVALLETARIQWYPRHAILFETGEKPEFLHIAVEGAVELFAQTDDQEATIAVLRPACTFILAAAMDDVPSLVSARTLQESRILTIPAEAVRSAFDRDNAFARAIMRELSRGFCDVLVQLKNQKLLTSVERLADWLLLTDAQSGGTGDFILPFGKRTLASELGMTPENLSRNLKYLSSRGALVRGRRVHLQDPAALAAIAHPHMIQTRATSRPHRGVPTAMTVAARGTAG